MLLAAAFEFSCRCLSLGFIVPKQHSSKTHWQYGSLFVNSILDDPTDLIFHFVFFFFSFSRAIVARIVCGFFTKGINWYSSSFFFLLLLSSNSICLTIANFHSLLAEKNGNPKSKLNLIQWKGMKEWRKNKTTIRSKWEMIFGSHSSESLRG